MRNKKLEALIKEESEKSRKRFEIQTGDFKKKVYAFDFDTAIISAFSLNPPKNPAILTRMRVIKWKRDKKTKENLWHYLETKKALEIAGY